MDDNEILDRILENPETVRTLMGNKYGRNSDTVCVKRRISRNIKNGLLQRVHLNGSRGGENLFIHIDRKYNVIIVSEHRNFKYYMCKDIKRITNSNTVNIIDPKELILDLGWKDLGNELTIYCSNVIKII